MKPKKTESDQTHQVIVSPKVFSALFSLQCRYRRRQITGADYRRESLKLCPELKPGENKIVIDWNALEGAKRK